MACQPPIGVLGASTRPGQEAVLYLVMAAVGGVDNQRETKEESGSSEVPPGSWQSKLPDLLLGWSSRLKSVALGWGELRSNT